MSDSELHTWRIVRSSGSTVRSGTVVGSRDEAVEQVYEEIKIDELTAYIGHPDGCTTRLTKMIAREWFMPSQKLPELPTWERGPYEGAEHDAG